MKLLYFALMLVILSACVFAIPIAKNGKSLSEVYLSENASEAEKYACEEFVKYIKSVSGADMSVVAEETEDADIFIGQSDRAKEIAGIKDWAELDDDEIIIVSKGGDLVLAGGKGSGTIYAVYEFLDTYLGVKFITHDDTYIPKNRNISIGPLNVRYKSPFMSRECYFKQFNNYPDYCLKLKMNGHHNRIDPALGGHVELLGWAHTFDTYIGYEKYGKDHPEWFAERGGVRLNREYSQLCISNKEMAEEMTANVLKTLEENPNTKILSLTQNDNKLFCECENCKALTEKYGHSGALLTLINQVADRVKEKYPDCLVETFAYNYTRHAPKGGIVSRDNVIIRLCSIEADFGKTFDQPSNEDFYANIENWSSITKNLYVWDYIVNFTNYIILHPNFHVLQKNLRIMRDHHAVAVFEQGDSFNSNACLHNYKRYITAKLLWNPELDFEKETKAFMKAYYGPAANDMYDFVNYVMNITAENPAFIGTYMFDNSYYSLENWTKMLELIGNAEKKAKGFRKYSDRVKMDRICLCAGIMGERSDKAREILKSRFSPYKNIIDILKDMNDFFPGQDLTYHQESQSWDRGPYDISKKDIKEGKVPEECKGLPDENWTDIQEKGLPTANSTFDNERFVKIVDADGASNGKAVRITSGSKEWYIQKRFSDIFLDKTILSGDFYAVVKMNPGTKTGKAIEIGFYNPGKKLNEFTVSVGAEDTPNSQWTVINLGKVDFNEISPGSYLYICGKGDDDLAKDILVDRIFVIYER